jgi:hypothetical protein
LSMWPYLLLCTLPVFALVLANEILNGNVFSLNAIVLIAVSGFSILFNGYALVVLLGRHKLGLMSSDRFGLLPPRLTAGETAGSESSKNARLQDREIPLVQLRNQQPPRDDDLNLTGGTQSASIYLQPRTTQTKKTIDIQRKEDDLDEPNYSDPERFLEYPSSIYQRALPPTYHREDGVLSQRTAPVTTTTSTQSISGNESQRKSGTLSRSPVPGANTSTRSSPGDECPICYGEMSQKAALSCGHVMCQECADRLIHQEDPKCYNCKKPVASVIPLFM